MAFVSPALGLSSSSVLFFQGAVAAAPETEAEAAEAAAATTMRENASYSMADWTHLAPEPGIGPLSFEPFPFLAPTSESTAGPGLPGIYSDEFANVANGVLKKSTQVGISSYAWRWAMRRAATFEDRVIYLFPTDANVVEFGRERIDPSILESPFLLARMVGINNAHQKQVGKGWLYLRGTTRVVPGKRAAGAQSTAAQALVFDEYDDLDPATVAQFERRLSGAKQSGRTARVKRFGVPTIDTYGISAAYDLSDMRRWHVACGCGNEQLVEWKDVRWDTSLQDCCAAGDDKYVNPEDVLRSWRACRECETTLDVRNGRWLADRPDRETIGYHVSRLIVPDVDLVSIVQNSRKRAAHEVEAFHQNDLGEAYSSDETGLTTDQVTRLVALGTQTVREYTGTLPVTMGVDTSGVRGLNVRISLQHEDGTRSALYVGVVESFGELLPLIDAYRVWLCCIDKGPERQNAQVVLNERPGRALMVTYGASDDDAPVKILHDKQMVSVNRADAIGATMAAIRDGRHRLPADPPPGYVEQMTAMKRRLVRDGRGRPRYVFVKAASGADDYMHAEVYDNCAREALTILMTADAYDQANNQLVTGGVDPVPLADEAYRGVSDGEYHAGFD